MTPTRWIIFTIIAVATLIGLAFFSGNDRVDVSEVDANKIVREGPYADHVFGNPDAKVVIYEYADFQCPACGSAFGNISSIKETYGDNIAFVFRHFPLTSIHPNALISAYAAEAADNQGKFWEMHDLLFSNQDDWESATTEQRGALFENYAEQLELDVERFKTDLTSEEVKAKVAYDRAVANKIGVSSTPTIYVNDRKMSDQVIGSVVQQNGDLLRDQINSSIRETGGTVPEAAATQQASE